VARQSGLEVQSIRIVVAARKLPVASKCWRGE